MCCYSNDRSVFKVSAVLLLSAHHMRPPGASSGPGLWSTLRFWFQSLIHQVGSPPLLHSLRMSLGVHTQAHWIPSGAASSLHLSHSGSQGCTFMPSGWKAKAPVFPLCCSLPMTRSGWSPVPIVSSSHASTLRAPQAAQAGLVLVLSPHSFSVQPWLPDTAAAGRWGMMVCR